MKKNHFSRKQRQLKYLVKKLHVLMNNKKEDVKSEIKKIVDKIKLSDDEDIEMILEDYIEKENLKK